MAMNLRAARQSSTGHDQRPSPTTTFWQATQAVALGLLAAGAIPAAETAPAAGTVVVPAPQDEAAHWSGRLMVGAYVVRSNSAVNPNLGPKTIAGTNGQADDRNTMWPAIRGELAVRFGRDGAEWFARMPLEDSGVSGGLRIGTCLGHLEVSGFYGFEEDVWRQPYQVDQARDRTSRKALGGDAALQRVAGTAFDLAWSLRSIEIDDDVSGRTWPALARSGLTQTWSMSYTAAAADVSWRPRLAVDRQDLEGRASASDGVRTGVAIQAPWRGLVWCLDGEVGFSRHRADHPIFGERRRDVSFRTTASTTATDVCGCRGITVTVLVGAMAADSNLAFYDETTWLSGVLIGYGF